MRKSILIMLILLSVLQLSEDISLAQRTKTSQRAGEQRKAEKGLKDNKYFFYFINTSISNFGSAEEKSLFKEAIQRDILARLLYMKYLFKESFKEIRKAQEILIDLYRITLKRDISATMSLLNGIAPGVVVSEIPAAASYLHLGYRDKKTAEIFLGMADNFRTSLYSLRLYQYVRAIKMAKHGKRYAFLAMIDSKRPEEERIPGEKPDYDELKKRIEKYSPPDKKDYFLRLHMDNYYKTETGRTFYDEIWDKPNIRELKEYQEYMDIPE